VVACEIRELGADQREMLCLFVCSGVNEDSRSMRTSSAGERFADEDGGIESSCLRHDNHKVRLTSDTSTDDGTTLSSAGAGDLPGRRCRSSLARQRKDVRPDRQQPQDEVHSHPASPGHVIPPPPSTVRSTTSPEATRRHPPLKRTLPPLPRPEVMPCSEHRENELGVGAMSRSSVSDDVFVTTTNDSASNKQLVDDVTEKNAAAASASTANVTSFPDSTTLSHGDVIGRLDKTNIKRYTLEVDSSAHSLLAALVQLSSPESHPIMRKTISCCELSAAVLRVDGENRKSATSTLESSAASTSARRPLLQLQLGPKFGVVCHQTEPRTSSALGNLSSETQKSSTDVENRPDSLDFNDNADSIYKLTKLAQTEAAWRRLQPSSQNERGTIAEENYFDVGSGCIEGDVIQLSSTANSSSRHERQLIFV